MTTHDHPCTMCDASPTCSDTCPTSLSKGFPRPCQTCSAVLDDIAEEPDPTRGELSVAGLVRCVARATRAALSADPWTRVETFNRYIDPLDAWDPNDDGADAWARRGCVAGAKAAWAADMPPGPVFRVPPDAPKGEPGAAYVGAWNLAGSIVLTIRMEMQARGNVT